MFRIEYKYRMQFVLLQFVLQLVRVPLSLNVQEESCHEFMHDPVNCLPAFLGVVTVFFNQSAVQSVLIMMHPGMDSCTVSRPVEKLFELGQKDFNRLFLFDKTSSFGRSLRFRNFLLI